MYQTVKGGCDGIGWYGILGTVYLHSTVYRCIATNQTFLFICVATGVEHKVFWGVLYYHSSLHQRQTLSTARPVALAMKYSVSACY